MRSSRRPRKSAAECATYASEAVRDLGRTIAWIAQDNPSAARGLGRAVDDAARRLARHPDLGRLRPEVIEAPYRVLTLTRYPYVIVYNGARTPPRILRILHGARDLPEVLRDLRDL